MKSWPTKRHQRNDFLSKGLCWLTLLTFTAISGCSLTANQAAPTVFPTQFLPTAVALTMQANRALFKTWTAEAPKQIPPTSPATLEAAASPTPEATEVVPLITNTPDPALLLPPASVPETTSSIPASLIQINNLGPYSRVHSPIPINVYLKPGKGGQVQIDLIGEGQKLLTRQIKPLGFTNRYGYTSLVTKLDFEISGTAESTWLVFSVFDEFGRTTTVNSVPLILIAIGQTDLIPPLDVLAPIVIQQPFESSLIQGKTLVAVGLARPQGDGYLSLQLLGQDGKVLGKRVTQVKPSANGGLGTFTIDVPYDVQATTPALLVVWEGEGSMSNVVYLTSVNVLLGP